LVTRLKKYLILSPYFIFVEREKIRLEVLTVETNQDQDRDVLFQSVKTFSTVEMSFFKVSRLSQQSRCLFSKCLDWDKDKNRDKSRLYSIDFVEICQDIIFQIVKNFSTVEMSFFKVSRKSWLSRLTFSKCRDWNSRSRHDQDKWRPPPLEKTQ
jgi:hypothetical protein